MPRRLRKTRLRQIEPLEVRLLLAADHGLGLTYDSAGNALYFDPAPLGSFFAESAAGGFDDGMGPEPGDPGEGFEIPVLHSRPEVEKKIYLDFDGQVVSGTNWNRSYYNNQTIHGPAYSVDDDIFSFSATEIDRIHEIWERVSEDYSPFDVDVTTEEPDPSVFTSRQGIRVLISTNDDDERVGGTGEAWTGFFGGLGYVNSWNYSSDTPVWVFYDNLGTTAKRIAEAAAHEAGHSLGLNHDSGDGSSYYSGHGDGDTGWAPIMGSSYFKNITQWSKGEYAGAGNLQDDVQIIAGKVGFRADDHTDVYDILASPTPLISDGGELLVGEGVIEDRLDMDVFQFSIVESNRDITLQAFPFHTGPNLDILLELRDEHGNLVASDNLENELDAVIEIELTPGEYLVTIDGVGVRTPDDGYSDYGSLGQYSVALEIRTPPPLIVGDFTHDGLVDGYDINALALAILNAEYSAEMDLIDDGVLSTLDMDELVYNILETNYGDANLDGRVDVRDFNIWNDSKFTVEHDGWYSADFNGDFQIDTSDFAIMQANMFTEGSGAALPAAPLFAGAHRAAKAPFVPRAPLSEGVTDAPSLTTDNSVNMVSEVPGEKRDASDFSDRQMEVKQNDAPMRRRAFVRSKLARRSAAKQTAIVVEKIFADLDESFA